MTRHVSVIGDSWQSARIGEWSQDRRRSCQRRLDAARRADQQESVASYEPKGYLLVGHAPRTRASR